VHASRSAAAARAVRSKLGEVAELCHVPVHEHASRRQLVQSLSFFLSVYVHVSKMTPDNTGHWPVWQSGSLVLSLVHWVNISGDTGRRSV